MANGNPDEALAVDEPEVLDEPAEDQEHEEDLLRSDVEDDDDDESASLAAPEPWYEFVNRDDANRWDGDGDAGVSSGEEWVYRSDDDDDSDDALSFDSDETEDCNDILPSSLERSPPVRLDWRMDPQESLSDFSLIIACNGRKPTVLYHVHKCILALGRERSDYFYKLVAATGSFTEHGTNSCTIRLEHEKLAKAFPVLLDYMYWIHDAPNFTTENVAALHDLGRYFGLARLCQSARDYWDAAISIQNCAAYYEDGTNFSNTGIIKVVKRICTRSIMDITPESRILEICDSRFLLDVLEAVACNLPKWNFKWFDRTTENHKILSKHLSVLVAGFCKLHSDALTPLQFIALTDWNFLPVVDPTAATDLLQLEKEIGGDVSADETLKARCIGSLARNWKEASASTVSSQLVAIDPDLLSLLYSETLECAVAETDRVSARNKACTEALEKVNTVLPFLEGVPPETKKSVAACLRGDTAAAVSNSESFSAFLARLFSSPVSRDDEEDLSDGEGEDDDDESDNEEDESSEEEEDEEEEEEEGDY